MISEIIKLILQIIAEWPQRQVQAAKTKAQNALKGWADFRVQNEKDKADRVRRAALLESTIVRPPTKGELQ